MLKNKKYILSFFIPFLMVMIFVVPFLLEAQGSGTTGEGGSGNTGKTPAINIHLVNPFKQDSIKGLIETLINDILMPIGAVVAVLMVMYAGFLYVTARGNPAQIGKAHQALLWAVIGAAILLGAWVISQAIQETIDQLRN